MNATTTAAPFLSDNDFAEERTAFQAVTGYAARSVAELEAWTDGPEVLAAYVAANPLTEATDAHPWAGVWDALTANVTVPVATPAAKPMPVTPTTPPAPRSLIAMTKAEVQAAFAAHYGIDLSGVPSSYTRKKLIQCIDGTATPGGTKFKAAVKAAAESKAGYAMPKSWTAAKIAGFVVGTQAPPTTSVAKAAMVAQVTAKFGACPKTYTVARCTAAMNGEIMPRIGGKRADGLTGDVCKKLLSAARAAGNKDIPAYSKLKADELRALVATLGLAS